MPTRPNRNADRRDPGWMRPFALAVAMHALLFALLAVGVAWHTEEPAAVQAELWSETVKESGSAPKAETPDVTPPTPVTPREVPPPIAPKPIVVPPEPVVPRPVPREVPPPVVAPPKPTQADIALDRQRELDRKRKEAEQQDAADRKRAELERQRQEQVKADQAKADKLKADQIKADQAKADKQKADDAQRQRDAAERQKADDDRKRKEADDKAAQAKADALAKANQAKADAAQKAVDAKARGDAVARMLASAGGSGASSASGGTGTGQSGSGRDAVSSGPRGDGGYAARVGQKIRGNTVFDVPDSLAGNPAVIYHVTLDPTGDVMDIRKTQSSGVPGFDEAVERAIRKSAPFPPDATGRPPREFDITHKPKDH